MDSRSAGWGMRAAGALALALALAGCGAERLSGGGEPPPPPPRERSGPGPLSPPPVDMAGRWQLSSPSGGACVMTFGSTPGSAEGTIAPEGGCPGNFFTSRKWTFEQGSLVIRDHK